MPTPQFVDKAPAVRSISDILATIDPALQPSRDLVNEQFGQVDARLASDTAGLEQRKTNEFRGITNSAQAKGVTFSGIPIQEQARYLGENFLPAVANLKIGAQDERIRLRDILNQIQLSAFDKAFSTSEGDQDKLFSHNERQGSQLFSNDQRVEGQKFQTSERVGSQNFQTSERLSSQDFTAGENAKNRSAQERLANISASASRASGGGGGNLSQWEFEAGGIAGMAQDIAQHKDLNHINADGGQYLSPTTYNQFKQQWSGGGLDGYTFDTNFSQFANPSHINDYALESKYKSSLNSPKLADFFPS